MIQKVKRILRLAPKTCLVCGASFQPASGAQKTCSPECKARARREGLTKRGPRKRGGLDSALLGSPAAEGAQGSGAAGVPSQREASASLAAEASSLRSPAAPAGSDGDSPEADLPDLEIDLSPLSHWVRAVVEQAIDEVVDRKVQTALREAVKGAVDQAIDERLKKIFAR